MGITLSLGRSAVIAEFPYDPALLKLVRTVPGREYDKRTKTWRFPLDVDCVRELVLVLPDPVRLDEPLRHWMFDEELRLEKLRLLRGSDPASLRYEYAASLYPFQRVAVGFLSEARHALLGDQMGLGKTAMAIATVREWELRGGRRGRYLVVCPNSKRHDWVDEIERWHPNCPPISLVDAEMVASPDLGWYVVNWEKTHRRSSLLGTPWDAVIADESHRMKGRDTKQSKAVRAIGKASDAPLRLLLTGTPVRNDVSDLWAQLNFLEPKRFSSFWRFWDQFVDFTEDFFGHKQVVGVKNEALLQRTLEPVMLARTAEDVELELPPLTHQRITVELEGDQRRAYDRMREEFVLWLEDQEDEIRAANWMVQVLRLKQIAGSLGTLYADKAECSAKLDALFELLDEAPGEKFVVFSQFATMIDLLAQRLCKEGIGHCVLTGKRSIAWLPKAGEHRAPNRTELIDWFNTSDKPRVFAATTQTGGEGITLTGARYLVFLDLMWTPAENEQALKRIHRIGQTKPCVIYTILAKDTVDFSHIVPKLKHKEKIIEAIMRPKDEPPDVQI